MLAYGIKPISKEEYISNCEEYIVQIEDILAINIPRSEKTKGAVCTYKQIRYKNDIKKEDIYEIGIKLEDEEEINELTKEIQNNEKWISKSFEKLMTILPIRLEYLKYSELSDNSYILIYNKTLNTYNAVPNEKGVYEYITLLYDSGLNEYRIFNYKINNDK